MYGAIYRNMKTPFPFQHHKGKGEFAWNRTYSYWTLTGLPVSRLSFAASAMSVDFTPSG